jgi:hypothetical protein
MPSTINSLAFLLSLREALLDVLDFSNIDTNEKVILKNYFLNEATDYEIVYFIVNGNLSQEKYSIQKERKVFSNFCSVLKEELSLASKYIDKKSIEIVINEFKPLSGEGLSSTVPVLEFLVNNDRINLSEQGTSAKQIFMKNLKDTWEKIGREYGANKSAISNVINFFKTNKGVHYAGAAVVVALATFASYRIYRNYLTKAAKACKNFTGPEKNNCMLKFKIEAAKQQLDSLKMALSACDSSQDPEKCKKTIELKIKKLGDKISKLSKKV